MLKNLNIYVLINIIIFNLIFNTSLAQNVFNKNIQPIKNLKIKPLYQNTYNKKFKFLMQIDLNDGWNTYWKDGGIAGKEPQFQKNKNTNIKKIVFNSPKPNRIKKDGYFLNIYKGRVNYYGYFELKNPKFGLNETINVTFYVCKTVCVPVTKKIKLNFSYSNKNLKSQYYDDIINISKNYPFKTNQNFYVNWSFKENKNILEIYHDKQIDEIFPYTPELNFNFIKKFKYKKNFVNQFEFIKKISPKNLKIYYTKENKFYVTSNITHTTKNTIGYKYIIITLITAFLAGLILNLMPCSISSLILYSSKLGKTKQSIQFAIGCMAFFVILALIIFIVNSFNIKYGWGMHFQNKIFLFVLLAFNLALFFKTKFFNLIASFNLSKNSEYTYGFVTTVIATPCGAPIISSLIVIAITSDALLGSFIMLIMGFGKAFPYIVFGFLKPNNKFKFNHEKIQKRINFISKLIIIIYILITIYLLSLQVKLIYIISLVVILSLLFLLNNKKIKTILFTICLFIIYLTSNIEQQINVDNTNKLNDISVNNYNNYFVNVTADWCVTCKINDVNVLHTDEFKNILKTNNIKYITLDWTKNDPVVLKYINHYNKYSIPFNLLNYNGKIYILDDFLTNSQIKTIIKKQNKQSKE